MLEVHWTRINADKYVAEIPYFERMLLLEAWRDKGMSDNHTWSCIEYIPFIMKSYLGGGTGINSMTEARHLAERCAEQILGETT